jgi:hypothetical protein
MPDRVDPGVADDTATVGQPLVDRVTAHPQREQMPSRDVSVLALRQLRDLSGYTGFIAHIEL